eukprot:scaffold27385_cov47-Attheya_sp.AAC.6
MGGPGNPASLYSRRCGAASRALTGKGEMEDWKFPQSSVAGCRDDMVGGVIVVSYSSVVVAVVWCLVLVRGLGCRDTGILGTMPSCFYQQFISSLSAVY